MVWRDRGGLADAALEDGELLILGSDPSHGLERAVEGIELVLDVGELLEAGFVLVFEGVLLEDILLQFLDEFRIGLLADAELADAGSPAALDHVEDFLGFPLAAGDAAGQFAHVGVIGAERGLLFLVHLFEFEDLELQVDVGGRADGVVFVAGLVIPFAGGVVRLAFDAAGGSEFLTGGVFPELPFGLELEVGAPGGLELFAGAGAGVLEVSDVVLALELVEILLGGIQVPLVSEDLGAGLDASAAPLRNTRWRFL